MVKEKTRFNKQRKIYEDSSRYLSIDFQNIIHFPITRMDLMFMKNLVEDMNKKGHKATKNLSLEKFNKVYDNTSLFHYFANDYDVINWVFNQFQQQSEEGTLSLISKRMPLHVCNPDKKGMNAFDWSLIQQKQSSFLKLVQFVEPFQEYGVTKMMLNCMPSLVQA